MTDMMRAVEISEPGGPEVLRLTERPVPEPEHGGVVIRVAWAGVNRPDALQRAGNYAPPKGASDLPGLEASGEVVAVGRAKGIEFPPDIVDATLALNAKFDPNAKNTLLLDLEAGRRLEHEWISGEIVRLGRELGAPTPFHEIAYAALKPFAEGG